MAKKAKKATKPRKRKSAVRGKALKAQKRKRAQRRQRGPGPVKPPLLPTVEGLGAESAGQSGDIVGLSRAETVDSESVAELAEEGQDYEAEVVRGVEEARDPDQGRVQTRRYVPPEER